MKDMELEQQEFKAWWFEDKLAIVGLKDGSPSMITLERKDVESLYRFIGEMMRLEWRGS
jgi:hypothetical protein